ncbi:MAG: hypothetical protein O9274_05705 [Limnobacter sp.]|uniref:hypothetical protein n=1 Tax=Limnobacter sp. TaxID=2003368 RepID=UPI0022CA8DEE|nr:hypothetical protein [Limnobacter sp.]MCZ8015174.1 hypothetical protein [Limnobacter sp.]
MKQRFLIVASLLLLFFQSTWAASVAVVVDVQGGATVKTPGSANKPLSILDYLPEQTELQLDGNGKVQLVSLRASQEWLLEGPGRYVIQDRSIELVQGKKPAKLMKAANTAGLSALEAPHKEKMALGAVVMRGESSAKMLGPFDTPVLANPPTLYWEHDRPVKVVLTEAGSGKLIMSKVVDARQLVLSKPLPAGNYRWSLRDEAKDSVLAEASFEVLAKNDARRRGLEWPVRGAVAQQVKAAAALDQAGFSYDAWLAWKTLAASRPQDEGLKAWVR